MITEEWDLQKTKKIRMNKNSSKHNKYISENTRHQKINRKSKRSKINTKQVEGRK